MRRLNSLIAIGILVSIVVACSTTEEMNCTAVTWYQDFDGDGLGNSLIRISACDQPEGYVANSDDTDDSIEFNCVNSGVIPEINRSRGDCNEILSPTPFYEEIVEGDVRMIVANSIPNHRVGLFGRGMGSLNPNQIREQESNYALTATPTKATSMTSLLGTGNGRNGGPQYSFGVLYNGVELDPVAAEPWPHEGVMAANVNWEWNLEATNVLLGLDCNNAHVQPTGKYHYHGAPTLFLEGANISNAEMTQIGFAADGFPIYYKYAYSASMDMTSSIVEMKSSYKLKSGDRPGDGNAAPCGPYNGAYSNDYEYEAGVGTLDEANGREGVTSEYPNGTYYYVVTEEFPSVPRHFVGTPSPDFRIGM